MGASTHVYSPLLACAASHGSRAMSVSASHPQEGSGHYAA